MPIVDDEDHLVGVVSEADLLRGEELDAPALRQPGGARLEPASRTVADVMTAHVLWVTEGVEAVDIARLMLETGVKSVPVVSAGKVIGVVSRSDIIHALATSDERIRDQVQALFGDAELHGWTVAVEEGEVILTGPDGSADARMAEVLTRTVSGVTTVRVVTRR
jgi:predicted transcriptional regulator